MILALGLMRLKSSCYLGRQHLGLNQGSGPKVHSDPQSSVPCHVVLFTYMTGSLSPNCVILRERRQLEMGASVFCNLFSNVTHHCFCHILLVIQTNAGTMWEGDFLSLWYFIRIKVTRCYHSSSHPTTHITTSNRRKATLCHLRISGPFQSPSLEFSLFFTGQNWSHAYAYIDY